MENLVVDSSHEVASGNVPKRLIVHQAHKYFFVAFHAFKEEIFKLPIEYGFEVLNRICNTCLTQLLIRNSRLAHLLKEKLVSRLELSSKSFVQFVD